MTPILGILASQISGHLTPPSSFESIATATGSGTDNITFSSIPSTYSHLQLRIFTKSSNTSAQNAEVRLQPNSDASAIYTYHMLVGNGTAASAVASTGNTYARLRYAGGELTNGWSASIIDIIDYASTTKNKTFKSFIGRDENGTGFVNMTSNLWASTTAISSLKVTISVPNFATGTSIALYGIKG